MGNDAPAPVPGATVGEDSSDKGHVGLRLARLWLDRSTRCEKIFTSRDRALRDLLAFHWPNSKRPFSFDLGGQFRGDTLDGQSFLAEVKNYDKERDLPDHFRAFLAKCYVALDVRPTACDNFLWISWAPFQAQQWDKHTTHANVVKALLHKANLNLVFGVDGIDEAAEMIDHERANLVANRVWLLTLSHRQDDFHLLDEHYKQVVAAATAAAS